MSSRRLMIGAVCGAFATLAFTSVEAEARVVHDDSDTYKGAGNPALLEGTYFRVWSLIDSHGGSNGDIWIQHSDDDLATWSVPVGPLVVHTSGRHLSEGALLATSTGRLIVAYNDIADSNLYDVRIRVIYSDDAGTTWSSAYTVPDSGNLTGEQAASCLIELANGDILLGAFGDTGTDANYISGIYRSTDGGATFGGWTVISTLHNPAEPWIIAIGSDLVAFMRSDVTLEMWRSASTDGGATWSVSTDAGALRGRPSVAEVFPGMLLWLGRSDNGPNFYRRWATSTDDGVSWTTPVALDVGETRRGEDANMLVVSRGRVLCFDAYEDTSTATTVYIREFRGVP